jgi:hypothetical protein
MRDATPLTICACLLSPCPYKNANVLLTLVTLGATQPHTKAMVHIGRRHAVRPTH